MASSIMPTFRSFQKSSPWVLCLVYCSLDNAPHLLESHCLSLPPKSLTSLFPVKHSSAGAHLLSTGLVGTMSQVCFAATSLGPAQGRLATWLKYCSASLPWIQHHYLFWDQPFCSHWPSPPPTPIQGAHSLCLRRCILT